MARIPRLSLVVGLALLAGCASPTRLRVQEPVEIHLGRFQYAVLSPSAAAPVLRPRADVLVELTRAQLLEEEIFRRVVVESEGRAGGLQVKLSVVDYWPGYRFQRLLGMGGDAEVAVDVTLVDPRKDETLGVMHVIGTSMGLRSLDDAELEAWALRSASEKIASFLAEATRRGNLAASP